MSINTDNYELFVIDYLDGNLDQVKAEEMSIFLLLHPDIAMEIDDLNMLSLEIDSDITIGNDFLNTLKHTELKKTEDIDEDNYEQFFVAQSEGDLGHKEIIKLQKFILANPSLKSEFDLSQSLQLQADTNIVFTNKESLKKKRKVIIPIWSIASSVAAILLLAIWVFKPHTEIRETESIDKMQSRTLANLDVNIKHRTLDNKESKLLISNISLDMPMDERERVALPIKIYAAQSLVTIEDNSWKKEMLLMQSYAFDRTQLQPNTDWASTESEKKQTAWRLVSSMLWKTTKGQIKNMSNELISDDLKLWQSGKFDELTDSYFSFKNSSTQE